MTAIDPVYRLLALCARAQSHPAFEEELAAQLRAFHDWHILPEQAEKHGMAPLLWHHLRNSRDLIPEETARVLRGLYLRHRIQNQAYARTLLDVMDILQKEGIRPFVLKGLALAYTIYPDPALRPLSDLDLVFKQNELLPAMRLLAGAGYQVEFPAAKQTPKTIFVTAPVKDGVHVHIEAHHYDPKGRAPNGTRDNEFSGFETPLQPVPLDGGTFYTPPPRETLLYLSRHLTRHLFEVTAEKPLQLKWVADIISLAEHHADSLDWDSLRHSHPEIFTRLEIFYSLTPPPPDFGRLLSIRRISPPAGYNQYHFGWPHYKINKWKKFGFWRFLRMTFTPPTFWWLKLYYGIEESSAFWYGHIVYPLEVLNLALWAIVDSW